MGQPVSETTMEALAFLDSLPKEKKPRKQFFHEKHPNASGPDLPWRSGGRKQGGTKINS
jgi:hypothetical protein